MSPPREGSREIDEGIIVSEAMDWCNSPLEPVPYRIWAKQIQATNLADSVRQTDDRSHVRGSVVLKCHGDEPGTGGGVVSGTNEAECTPKTWSETVRAGGRNMVRHDDEWWMNHKNTWGRLCFVKDQTAYPTQEEKKAESLLDFTKKLDALPPGSDQYEALERRGYVAPAVKIIGEGALAIGAGALSIVGAVAGTIYFMSVKPAGSKKEDEAVLRVTKKHKDDCCIAAYSYNAPVPTPFLLKINPNMVGQDGCKKCTQGQKSEAHHGMIDYPFRTGTQSNPGLRTPGAPAYNDALTVCVPSGPGRMSLTNQHKEVHDEFEQKLEDYQGSGIAGQKQGIATYDDVKKASFDAIDKIPDTTLSKYCKQLYKDELTEQYKKIPLDMPLRSTVLPPKEGSDALSTLTKAWSR